MRKENRLDSRIFLKGTWNEKNFGPFQPSLFPEVSFPPEIYRNYKMKDPLQSSWILPEKLVAECSNYFIRKWTKDWAMRVLRHAAMQCKGEIQYDGISYKVIFCSSEREIGWIKCPEEIEELRFSFRSHERGNFCLVQVVRLVKD